MNQKEQITQILIHVERLSLEMGQMKIVQSDMQNKQEGFIKKQDWFISIMENNETIGKIGYIQRVDENTERIEKVETTIKVTLGKIVAGGGVLMFIGAFLIKVFDYFKT